MKTSSITVNTVIIFSCMLIFMGSLSVLLTYGTNQYDINEKESKALCYVRSILAYTSHVYL